MAQFAPFNPVQDYQRARSNALSMQRQEQAIQREREAAPIRSQMDKLGLEQAQKGVARSETEYKQEDAIQKATILHNTAKAIRGLDPSQYTQAVASMIPQLKTFGIDTSQFEGIEITPEGLDQVIAETQGFIKDPNKLAQLSSGQRERRDLMTDLEGAIDQNTGKLIPVNKMTARQRAAAVKLRLVAPPVGSAIQTIADKGTGQEVADVEKTIATGKEEGKLDAQGRLAPDIEKQKVLAKDAGALSTEIFKRIGAVELNVGKLKEGIRLIDEGANVGPIDKWFPSFKPASIKLDNLKNRLGLDVISSITFGALSEKELQVAFDTAMPSNLDSDELKIWFQERIDAQTKLLAALEDSGIFLAEDGATIPKLMARRRQQRGQIQQPSVKDLSDDELFN